MSYATITQLHALGINSDALTGIADSTKTMVLAACSAKIDDAIETGGRYATPLTTYPMSLTLCCCKLAQFELLSVEGYEPDEEDQKTIRLRYEDAMKCLENLSKGAAISGVADATPDEDESEVVVGSDEERGWGYSKDADDSVLYDGFW